MERAREDHYRDVYPIWIGEWLVEYNVFETCYCLVEEACGRTYLIIYSQKSAWSRQ